jgi:hypothetical protein
MDTQPAPGLLVIERILRDRDGIWRQIVEEQGLRKLTVQMLVSSAISLALYGAVMGANDGFLQSLSSAVKLPLLFLATLAICLPTLYLFNLVFGARLSVLQAVTLIMVCITVTSVLSLAFAPISLFFLITAKSYMFFKLLNVGILVLTSLVGLKFLTAGMRELNDHHERAAAEATRARIAAANPVPATDPAATAGAEREPALAVAAGAGAPPVVTAPLPAGPGPAGGPAAVPPNAGPMTVPPNGGPIAVPPNGAPPNAWHPHLVRHQPVPAAQQRSGSMTLLYIWILLFGFVGTQLGWTLRPFFGSPGESFELFRDINGTFYGDIFNTIGHLFGN